MTNVYSLNDADFPFEQLSLATPQGLQGGAYLSKIKINNNPLSFQNEPCYTKNGIVKTDKKIYCDLIFDNDNESLINFFSKLEDTIKTLIFEKRESWFHSDMDIDTIDYHWQSMFRTYQNNKYLLRCFVKKPKNSFQNSNIYIYDEHESPLTLEDITKDKKIITIIKFVGLKFTAHSFSIDIVLDQVMVLDDYIEEKVCLIKNTNKKNYNVTSNHSNKDAHSPEKSITHTTEANETETNETESNKPEENETESNKPEENETEANETEVNEPEENDTTNEKSTNILQKDLEGNYKESADSNVNLKISNPKINNSIPNNNEKNELSLAINKDNNSTKLEESKKYGLELDEINVEDIAIENNKDSISLRPPNEVYREILNEVRKKAKEAKQRAIEAYLEVKRIKTLYNIEENESSDEEINSIISL